MGSIWFWGAFGFGEHLDHGAFGFGDQLDQGAFGPGSIWTRKHLDRRAFGPESIWFWGAFGQRAFGPGSIWTGEHLNQGAFEPGSIWIGSIWWGAFGREHLEYPEIPRNTQRYPEIFAIIDIIIIWQSCKRTCSITRSISKIPTCLKTKQIAIEWNDLWYVFT